MGEGLEEGFNTSLLEFARENNSSIVESEAFCLPSGEFCEDFSFETDFDIPKIKININTFTDFVILESTRRAVEVLREEYGIFIEYDINNFSLTYGAGDLIGGVEAIIDLFGKEKIIIDEFNNIDNLTDLIVEETLKLLGRSDIVNDHTITLPFRRNEPPRMATAVLL